jgi:hypothetical protein
MPAASLAPRQPGSERQEGDQGAQQHSQRRADHGEEQAVDDGALGDRVLEEHPVVVVQGELLPAKVGGPQGADRAQEDGDERQRDGEQQIGQAHGQNDPAEEAEPQASWMRALAADRGLGARSEQASL